MDASTGEVLWTYEPHLPPDPLGEVVCCGWDNRGVAIGDGMVFVSQLNGDQVALDQETGKVKWSTPVVKPGSGFSITSAPLYYNGKVYVGGSGGEYGVRGRLTALDAKTGKIRVALLDHPEPEGTRWRTPGPTTAPTSTAAPASGTRRRSNPKTEHALLLDLQRGARWIGAERARATTSSPPRSSRWTPKPANTNGRYQEVHHDLWDYDAPSPTVLFNGEMNGKMVEAVGEPEKTGWVYLVDQKTGKPIYPIPEVKVPQDPSQKTSPTQPEPTMEPFSPVTKTNPAAVEESGRRGAGQKPEPKVVGVPDLHPDEQRPERDERGRRTRRSVATTGRRPPTTRKRTCTSSARSPACSA